MGYPMAGHLAKEEYPVTVYNRTAARARNWVDASSASWAPVAAAATPAEAAEKAEIVFVCVGNDDDVRSVVYGDTGVLAGLAEGGVLVDHTTASAELARELEAACEKKGVGFLDAPVSGGQNGAENGQLTVMVGGRQEIFEGIAPV
ncbi:MAG: oxidoreductase, partial [Pseudomonadales bacterium]|nr:oxidoreductase [Pseudomonadales bacterium]